MDSIITKLTDELRKENVEDSKIDSIVHNLKSYWQYVGTIDLDNINYVTILKAIILAKFLKKKFDDNMGFSIMQKSLVYRDNDICIFKPTNFEESRIIGEPICCFAYSQDRWDEHYIGNEEAIYYVYDVMRDDTQDFVAITVRPNGNARVLDKNHNWWTSSDSIKYIQTLGKGASLIVTKDGKPINTTIYNQETNENKIMNKKQVIRLNENQLNQIVTESVKRVLKENEYNGSDNWTSTSTKDFQTQKSKPVKQKLTPTEEEILRHIDYYKDCCVDIDTVIDKIAKHNHDWAAGEKPKDELLKKIAEKVNELYDWFTDLHNETINRAHSIGYYYDSMGTFGGGTMYY